MSRSYLLLICNVLAAWGLTGCATPGSRAREHAAAFHRLSPADQQLVLHGRIRPGLSQEAVDIAWGQPDEKTVGCEGKDASETWIYRPRVTINEPMDAYYGYGPSHGFGGGHPGHGFLPAYAYGGIGYEGTLRYQPHVRSLDSVRIAEFGVGKLDRYKNADDRSLGSAKLVATTLTSAPADRKLPHVAQHHVAKISRTIQPQRHAATVSHPGRPHSGGSVHPPHASRHLVARHVLRLRRYPGKSG